MPNGRETEPLGVLNGEGRVSSPSCDQECKGTSLSTVHMPLLARSNWIANSLSIKAAPLAMRCPFAVSPNGPPRFSALRIEMTFQVCACVMRITCGDACKVS